MQPQSPGSQFDFMLKSAPPPQQGLSIFNLPKAAKIAIAAVLAIILLIVISSVLSNRGKGSTQPIVGVLARGQEIQRVTQLVQQQLQQSVQDPDTLALAATVSGDLASDQQQLTSYLAANHVKVSKLQLTVDTDKSTDSLLQSAAQNANLDQTYINYLRQGLSRYETDLQTAYKAAGPNGKAILQSAYQGTTTMLGAPPLKS